MLYKKYHRNFVRQFKKGTKIKYRYKEGTETIERVVTKPFIYRSSIKRKKYCWIELELSNGYLKIIDDKGRKITGYVEILRKQCYTKNIIGTTLGSLRKELS